jgi:simple sugar transport system permease protein
MSTPLSRLGGRVTPLVGSVFDRRESSVMVGVLVIFLIGALVSPQRFLTLDNLFRVLRGAAIITVIGYGMAILMVTAEFDLSVGSMFALSSGLVAIMIGEFGYDPIFAIVFVLAFAVVYGISQGLLVTKLGLPSLIITIGTLTLVRGVHRLVLSGQSVTIGEEGGWALFALGGVIELPFQLTYRVPFVHDQAQQWGEISIQIVWVFLLLAAFHYLLFYTRFGYRIRATGDNINSVETTGVDPEYLKLACFGVAAAMAAFAGIMRLGRIGSVSPNSGNGLALIVIAAVVLGGTKLVGGEGSMVGVLLGAVVLSLAQNVLAIAGFGVGGYQAIITGLFIIAAIGLDTIFKGFHAGLLSSWYTDPLGNLVTSPARFFRERAIQKTSDDVMAFLVVSVGVTGLLLYLEMMGMRALMGAMGVSGVSFDLFIAGGWLVAMLQFYLVVAVLAILALVTIGTASQWLGGTGDYESNLIVVCYGLAPIVLLSIPQVTLGYTFAVLGSPVVTALAITLVVLLLIGWLMTIAVSAQHELPRRKAVVPVLATIGVWAAATLWVLASVA